MWSSDVKHCRLIRLKVVTHIDFSDNEASVGHHSYVEVDWGSMVSRCVFRLATLFCYDEQLSQRYKTSC